MTRHSSRREVLRTGAATVAAATAMGRVAMLHAGSARSASLLDQIDALLRAAVEARDLPGVVAMAATDKGILYQGAFGGRDLATGNGDDIRHGLPHRLHDQGGDLDCGHAARRT